TGKMHCNTRVFFAIFIAVTLLGVCFGQGGGGGGGGGGGMGGKGNKHGGGSRIIEMLAAGMVAKMLSEMQHGGCHHG
ncbi:hypothetical protein X975_21637, partial [Stegodyphus mimosarum]